MTHRSKEPFFMIKNHFSQKRTPISIPGKRADILHMKRPLTPQDRATQTTRLLTILLKGEGQGAALVRHGTDLERLLTTPGILMEASLWAHHRQIAKQAQEIGSQRQNEELKAIFRS